MSKGGLELVLDAAIDAATNRVIGVSQTNICESPIERLFFCALDTLIHTEQGMIFGTLAVIRSEEMEKEVLARSFAKREELEGPEGELIVLRDTSKMFIRPQAQIEQWRVDFLIHTLWDGPDDRWRRLIVECDGHDFHDRTKQQAARDRSRDRALTLLGYDVFRFTGSELWRDPMGCAAQVIKWGWSFTAARA